MNDHHAAWALFWETYRERLDDDQRRSYELDQIDGFMPPQEEHASMLVEYGE